MKSITPYEQLSAQVMLLLDILESNIDNGVSPEEITTLAKNIGKASDDLKKVLGDTTSVLANSYPDPKLSSKLHTSVGGENTLQSVVDKYKTEGKSSIVRYEAVGGKTGIEKSVQAMKVLEEKTLPEISKREQAIQKAMETWAPPVIPEPEPEPPVEPEPEPPTETEPPTTT